MKVLIVDDSPHALSVARARLSKEGLTILCAGSGQSGLEMAGEHKPDLILLDLVMPGMSGFDVCRALKSDPELVMIPVVFVTGSGSTSDKVKGLDLGAVDYVTKPFSAFELRARVRAALRTKRLQDLLVKHARIDPLTELWNRRALMDQLRREWRRTRRYGGKLAFIMCDIDRFKRINDRYGHHVGDRMLCRVAGVIAAECRGSDFPARYGGEEFAIIVPEQEAEEAAHLAERCRRGIEAIRLDLNGRVVQATASFGVAGAAGLPSAEVLIQSADEALYRAKQGGRNRIELAGSTRAPSPNEVAPQAR